MAGKTKAKSSDIETPVWCGQCQIRIAPYASRTEFQNKQYHPECFLKRAAVAKKQKPEEPQTRAIQGDSVAFQPC